ncbi:hypothetical protein LOK49_Contig89G00001, partial [Camellia lanceoleosa]
PKQGWNWKASSAMRVALWEIAFPTSMFGLLTLIKFGSEMVNICILEGLEVTDDVSIVEHLKHPVYITEGSYTNIK